MSTARTRHTRIIISGCCGRMGQRLVALTHQATDLVLVGALESAAHPLLGRDVGECAGLGPIGVRITAHLAQVARRGDVLIEFSSPAATIAHAREAAKIGCALVIGTTGLPEPRLSVLQQVSRKVPVLVAPNMSVGVNVLYQLAEQAVRALGPDYDIEIVETHHAGKKDAPSGTARRLAEVLAHARGSDLRRVGVHGRQGLQPRGSHQEIGIHAVRAGDVVGDHQVILATPGERVELIHRASSRDTFAHGALRAARFLAGRRPGLYDMRDVLGLR